MSKPSDVQKSVERMKICMELRGLRPNTAYTFAHCARRFLAHVGKPLAAVTSKDVEGFLLDLARKGRSPRTRNVNLSAVRCLLFATIGDKSRVATTGIDLLDPFAPTAQLALGSAGRARLAAGPSHLLAA